MKTDNIFQTLRELRKRSDAGGFNFMPPASDAYYRSALAIPCSPILVLYNEDAGCTMMRKDADYDEKGC